MAIQSAAVVPISVRSASFYDVKDCVDMMWKDVLSKEVPEGQSAQKLAHDVYSQTRFPQLYEIKEGDKLLAFGLILIMGENYHL